MLSTKTRRLAVLTALGVSLAAGVAYLVQPSLCETDRQAIVGEVRRESEGKFLYFDGRCWTTQPMPPTDTPF